MAHLILACNNLELERSYVRARWERSECFISGAEYLYLFGGRVCHPYNGRVQRETSNLPAPMKNQKILACRDDRQRISRRHAPSDGVCLRELPCQTSPHYRNHFFGPARLADAECMSTDKNGQDLGGSLNPCFFGFLGACCVARMRCAAASHAPLCKSI